MNLEKFRKFLGSAKGVVAYITLDRSGRMLTQNKGILSDNVNNTEFSSWALNYFHAIDTYYPESESSILRFGSLYLYLRRDEQAMFAIVMNHEANLAEFEEGFNALCTRRARAVGTTGIIEEKSRKGETVFLRISDTGPSATSAPMPVRTKGSSSAGLSGKKKGSPVGIIIGVVVVIAVAVGAVMLTSGGGTQASEEAETLATTAPQPAPAPTPQVEPEPEPEPEADPRQEAARLRAEAEELAALAAPLRSSVAAANIGRGTLSRQAGEDSFAAGDYDRAITEYSAAIERFGEALVSDEKARFNRLLEENGLTAVVAETPEVLGDLSVRLAEADERASRGEFIEAYETLRKLSDGLPALRTSAKRSLADLAATNAEQGRVAVALAFYRQVYAIDPDHEAAAAFLYRNAFEPGETTDVMIADGIDMTLAYIPPGTFTMGASPADDPDAQNDETPHEVTLTRGYFIGVHEVTQAQWEAVMGRPITMKDPDAAFIGPRLPAHHVDRLRAEAYCQRLSEMAGETFRLPTEAEWEYACRAGTTTPFNTGRGTLTFNDANILSFTGDLVPAAVGTSGPANQWGLFDMHGNVQEWCADWYGDYPEGPVSDPVGPQPENPDPSNLRRLARGGSFQDEANVARSANRIPTYQAVSNGYTGFRVVKEVSRFPSSE